MNIIIGLGNPGPKFKNTRHNVGFMAVDELAEQNGFEDFKLDKKSNALICEGQIAGEKTLLAKPQTFMNESGKSAGALARPYTQDPKPLIIIIHDDIDLPLGKIKISKDRGSAGHKGVESIIQAIGNENLIRIRIGIAPTTEQSYGPDNRTKAIDVVLKKFSKEEQKLVEEAIQKSVQATQSILTEGPEKAMSQFNQ